MKLPTKEESLARPTPLTRKGMAAHKAVMEVLGKDCDPGGCQTFYSPQEWKERGESYGHGSVLVVVFDGGDAYEKLSYHSDFGASYREKLRVKLEKQGLYFEDCTNWYLAIYED